MLDLLIAEQKEGRIDDQGMQEEVDTFTFEVSRKRIFFLQKKISVIIVLIKVDMYVCMCRVMIPQPWL